MTRLFLTFLALLTGLVAQSVPAAARVCDVGGAQVGALDAPVAAVRSTVQGQQFSEPRVRPETSAIERGCGMQPRPKVLLPTVQLGPDRARE